MECWNHLIIVFKEEVLLPIVAVVIEQLMTERMFACLFV